MWSTMWLYVAWGFRCFYAIEWGGQFLRYKVFPRCFACLAKWKSTENYCVVLQNPVVSIKITAQMELAIIAMTVLLNIDVHGHVIT